MSLFVMGTECMSHLYMNSGLIYAHIHLSLSLCPHLPIYIYKHIHTCIHAHINTSIHASTKYIHSCMHTYIHTYKQSCIQTYTLATYTHTYLHTYIHASLPLFLARYLPLSPTRSLALSPTRSLALSPTPIQFLFLYCSFSLLSFLHSLAPARALSLFDANSHFLSLCLTMDTCCSLFFVHFKILWGHARTRIISHMSQIRCVATQIRVSYILGFGFRDSIKRDRRLYPAFVCISKWL